MERPASLWCSQWIAIVVAVMAHSAFALTCGAAPLPIDEQAEADLLAVAGEGSRIKRTDHFLIAYDAPDAVLADFVHRAEATYASASRFCKVGKIPARFPERRIEMLFFDRRADFVAYAASVRFAARGTSGFYHRRVNRAAFFNAMNSPQLAALNAEVGRSEAQRSENAGLTSNPQRRKAVRRQLNILRNRRNRFVERINLLVVQHEVAHAVLFNAGVHVRGGWNPSWLVEGLACLFETPPSKSGAGFGAVNQMRLADFRDCLTADTQCRRPKPEHLAGAYRTGRFVRLQELVSNDRLFSEPSAPNAANRYAQAWSLVLYLQHHHRHSLAEYIGRIARRSPDELLAPQRELAAFEAAFGPIDDRFERRWVTFVLDLPFRPSQAGR